MIQKRKALKSMSPRRFVVVDTTFSRVDMGSILVDELGRSNHVENLDIQRYTVPGFKDLAAYARRSIDGGANIVLAAAMPGPEPIDESCAKDASFGLQMVQAMTGVSVLEIFVHMTEALNPDRSVDEQKLSAICEDRCREHALNAIRMVFDPAEMVERAGSGRRQGGADVGPV